MNTGVTRTLAPVAILVGLGLAHCLLYLANDVDDAYISYRYARSLAEGRGLTFNPGERVEGFSNPLWVIAAAVPLRLGAEDPHAAMQALGIALSCGTIALLFAISRRLFEPDSGYWAWIAPLWLLTRPGFAFYTCSGLETPLFVFWMTLALFFWLRNGPGAGVGVVMGLAALTRPEAPWIIAVLLALSLGRRGPGRARVARRDWLIAIGAFAAIAGAWTIFRWIYFGELLPNTYFAKRMPVADGLATGLHYFQVYLRATWGAPLIALGIVFWRRRPPFVRLGALWLLMVMPILRLGADWMPEHRFFVHALSIEALVVAGAARGLAEWVLARRLRWAPALLGVLLLPPLGLQLLRSSDLAGQVNRARPVLQRRCRALGQTIRENPEIRRIALVDIGKIGYHAGLPIIDLVGLTDRVIARSPGYHVLKRYDPRIVLRRAPELIILRSQGPGHRAVDGGWILEQRGVNPVEWRLYTHPAFRRDYFHAEMISAAEPATTRTGYYHLFRRHPVTDSVGGAARESGPATPLATQ